MGVNLAEIATPTHTAVLESDFADRDDACRELSDPSTARALD